MTYGPDHSSLYSVSSPSRSPARCLRLLSQWDTNEQVQHPEPDVAKGAVDQE